MNQKLNDNEIIPIEKPCSSFQKHLETNDRIIFSGSFGMGKTFFLNKFFRNEENINKYNVFHFFPTNYQLSYNQDIIELIKYDILAHIIEKDWLTPNQINVISREFAARLVFNRYVTSTNIVYIIGKSIKKIGNSILKSIDECQFTTQTEFDKIKFFVSNLLDGSNCIDDEFDVVLQIIKSNIQAQKQEGKQNVLIVDDLDRIDPGHIFHLLNVFAAHFDIHEGRSLNKYGFDKVIFVCDINNIRNIFTKKYGADTDFSGYINKFYSSEIYNFDNKKAIEAFVQDKLLPFKENLYEDTEREIYNRTSHIICKFIEANTINLRQLFNLKHPNHKGTITNNSQLNEDFPPVKLPVERLIRSLLFIFGYHVEALIKAFQNASTMKIEDNATAFVPNNYAKSYLPWLLLLINNNLLRRDHASAIKTEIYNNEDINLKVIYNIISGNIENMKITDSNDNIKEISFSDICILFIEAINIMAQNKLVYIE